MDTRSSYTELFMTSLRRLRDNDTCDVTLKLSNQSAIDCHRLVLMAASPFFETMFRSGLKEGMQREVVFDFSSAEITENIIDYFYSGEIDINSENVQDLIAASEYLCLDDLKRHLCAFMTEQVDPTNCIEFYRFSRKYNLRKLVPHCLEYILSHFSEAFSSPKSFDELSEEELIEVVSDDRLTAENEDIVFYSVVRWVNEEPEKRKEAFPRIASFIRFPFCTQECLSRMTREALMMNPTCMEFLHEGLSLDVRSKRVVLHSTKNARIVPRYGYDTMKPHLMQISVNRSNIVGQSIDRGSHTWQWKLCFQAPIQANFEVFFSSNGIHWREVQGLETQHTTGFRMNSMNSTRNRQSRKLLFRWDVETQRITNSSWMEPQMSDFTLMFVREKIFAFGGTRNGQPCDMVESFDQTREQWSPESPMLQAVSKPYVVNFDSKIYVLGGVGTDGPSLFTQEFDPLWGIWKLKKPMPGVCQFGAAVSLNDNIFVVGGNERACFRYTPATNIWTVLSQPAYIHNVSTAATALNGHIIVCERSHAEMYNVDGDYWSSCEKLIPKAQGTPAGLALCTMYTDGPQIDPRTPSTQSSCSCIFETQRPKLVLNDHTSLQPRLNQFGAEASPENNLVSPNTQSQPLFGPASNDPKSRFQIRREEKIQKRLQKKRSKDNYL